MGSTVKIRTDHEEHQVGFSTSRTRNHRLIEVVDPSFPFWFIGEVDVEGPAAVAFTKADPKSGTGVLLEPVFDQKAGGLSQESGQRIRYRQLIGIARNSGVPKLCGAYGLQ